MANPSLYAGLQNATLVQNVNAVDTLENTLQVLQPALQLLLEPQVLPAPSVQLPRVWPRRQTLNTRGSGLSLQGMQAGRSTGCYWRWAQAKGELFGCVLQVGVVSACCPGPCAGRCCSSSRLPYSCFSRACGVLMPWFRVRALTIEVPSL